MYKRQTNASARFDLEVASDITTLQKTLLAKGWQVQPAADWVTALRLLDDSTPAAERPVLPVALNAHPERLLLRRASSDFSRIEVLRVWPAPVRLADGTPLWVARYERMQLRHRLRLLTLCCLLYTSRCV